MRPITGSPVYRPDLGVMAVEYMEDGLNNGYIADKVMPAWGTADQSGGFPVIPAKALLSIEDTERASGSAWNRSEWTYEDGKYFTLQHGHEQPIDDRNRKIFDRRVPNGSDMIALDRAFGIMARAREKRVADKVFNATNFTAHALTNEWDDATNSVPIDDVATGKLAIRGQCGMEPNTLIITYYTFLKMRRSVQIIDQLKYTFPGIDINRLTVEQLAAVLDVPRILVGGAVYDSANKGLAKDIDEIWNYEYAMLTITSDNIDIVKPCIGRTFMFDTDTSEQAIVEVYREEQISADVYRIRNDVDERFIQSFDATGTVVSDIAASVSYLYSNVSTIA